MQAEVVLVVLFFGAIGAILGWAFGYLSSHRAARNGGYDAGYDAGHSDALESVQRHVQYLREE